MARLSFSDDQIAEMVRDQEANNLSAKEVAEKHKIGFSTYVGRKSKLKKMQKKKMRVSKKTGLAPYVEFQTPEPVAGKMTFVMFQGTPEEFKKIAGGLWQ